MNREGRAWDKIRDVSLKTQVNMWAEGSAEIHMGNTVVLCTASVLETTPKWLNKPGQGWVTAEYGMLPRSNDSRISRERGFNSGRAQEISRLIGRSLRASVDLNKLGERQIQVDCDVLQADGGTRTAGITGGFVALALALKQLKDKTLIREIPLKNYVAACSVGFKHGKFLLDLDSKEDKSCGVDMNLVMNDHNQFIEIQGTAETETCSKEDTLQMMDLGQKACQALFKKQEEILGAFFKLASKEG